MNWLVMTHPLENCCFIVSLPQNELELEKCLILSYSFSETGIISIKAKLLMLSKISGLFISLPILEFQVSCLDNFSKL